MDSVKTVGVNFFSYGVWLVDAIPFILQTSIGLLTIIYLTLKIKKLKEQ
tara:strand:- start:739 stop:885 length:147 start_codon:yes stop_codon:yes gene_type:complete